MCFLRALGLSFLLCAGTAGVALAAGKNFSDELDAYNTKLWLKSDGWTNNGMFNCGWRADHIGFSGGTMTLTLDSATCPGGCSGKPYAAGEYRSLDVYGYGTFFIYDQTFADEIDVEILGRDTTQIQTNYFTNGVGGHETFLHLGFDASLAFHNYAVVWRAGSIKWYVDDVLILTETGSRGPLPTVPGKIMLNLWPGIGVDSWLGPLAYLGPLNAQVDRIQYSK
jgi:beta-glucanase (GH16 family)